MKSILNLTIDELKEVVKNDTLPLDVNLTGLEERKDFQKLFRFRSSPKMIASALLKEKLEVKEKRGGSHDTEEVKKKRLELKEKELELKKLKAEGTSYQLKQIHQLLSDVNKKLDFLIRRKEDE